MRWLKAGLLIVVGCSIALLSWEAWQTMREIRRASRAFADYSVEQTTLLRSRKVQKAIESGLVLPAAVHGSVRLLNTKTLPGINKLVETLGDLTVSLETITKSTQRVVEHTDSVTLPNLDRLLESVNDNLVFELSELARQTRVDSREVAAAFVAVAAETGVSQQELLRQSNQLLNNPDLLRAINSAADNLENLEQTSKELPPIARGIQKWQRPLAIARLIALFAGLW